MDEIQQLARALAERLLADLKAGRRDKVGLEAIETEAREIAIGTARPAINYRLLVDWTIRELVERAAK